LKPQRVALVHDWLVSWRGGEKVLQAMAALFPQAPIYTLFHHQPLTQTYLEGHHIQASFLNTVPGAKERHRWFLPAMPWAISRIKIANVDLVISSSHCVAKSVRIPAGAKHLSYVHAPMRYMYDRFDDYFGPGRSSLATASAARFLRPALQKWDQRSHQVDRFLANSKHVQSQIRERYVRESRVLYPPVDLDRFLKTTQTPGRGHYFLCLGALAPYKRIDLAIEAFRGLAHELWIGGSGQSRHWLASLPPNVKALGQVSDADLPDLYANCRALIFPGVEDFGITPLEAQAAGRPVVALAQGGALETLTRQTGMFFHEQSVASLRQAVRDFEAFETQFDPSAARRQAARFSLASFTSGLRSEIEAM
jgi:glycosyltransferase involved in cell wall biosynthesis